MTRAHLPGGVVATVAAFVVAGCGGTAVSPVSAPPARPQVAAGPLESYASVAAMLDNVHTTLVSAKLALLRAEFTALAASTSVTDRFDFTVSMTGVAWAPKGDAFAPSGAFDAWVTHPSAADLARLSGLAPGTRLLVAVSRDHEALAVAELDGSGEVVDAGPQFGLFFLEAAARGLAARRTLTAPRDSRCAPARTLSLPATPAAALTSYFTQLGSQPLAARARVSGALDAAADRIEQAAGPAVDAVTGESVPVDLNDIRAQLADGVRADRVVVRRTVSTKIDVSGMADPAHRVVVFFDARSHRLLGWVNAATPSGSNGILQSYLGIPDPGSPVAVYLRSSATAFDCWPGDSGRPLVTVPYEAFAGSSRAVVVVSESTYHVQ